MDFKLRPVTTGGLMVVNEDSYTFTCLNYAGGKKVATVLFKNQGVQSNAYVQFGGATLTVAPGATIADVAPTLCYLQSEYTINFKQYAGPAVAKNELVIIVQTFVNEQ